MYIYIRSICRYTYATYVQYVFTCIFFGHAGRMPEQLAGCLWALGWADPNATVSRGDRARLDSLFLLCCLLLLKCIYIYTCICLT